MRGRPASRPPSGGGVVKAGDPRPETSDEGGDPACWLNRVCPECGRLADDEPPTRCPACGAAVVPPPDL